jgi:hypothetical protein
MPLFGRECREWKREALTVEALALSQDLLDVTSHNLVHLGDVLAQLAQVALCPGVKIQLSGLLYESV